MVFAEIRQVNMVVSFFWEVLIQITMKVILLILQLPERDIGNSKWMG